MAEPKKQNIQFNIKFITHALIGSAENSSTGDSSGLTGTALREAWRFWFRAIVGGCLKNPQPRDIALLEEKVFGSLKNKTFGLSVNCTSNILKKIHDPDKNPDYIYRLPKYKRINDKIVERTHRERAPFYRPVPPDTEFTISILPSKDMKDKEKLMLLATIWVWAHLGAVGNRARRGFGSLFLSNLSEFNKYVNNLKITDTDNPINIILPETIVSDKFPENIKMGLTIIYDYFRDWIGKYYEGILLNEKLEMATRPVYAPFFILSSLDQIAIGEPFSTMEEGLEKVHGTHIDTYDLGFIGKPKRTNEKTQETLNKNFSRWASPIYIRFHRINNYYIPLMTWCHQKLVSHDIDKYNEPESKSLRICLQQAHFENTITGKEIYDFR